MHPTTGVSPMISSCLIREIVLTTAAFCRTSEIGKSGVRLSWSFGQLRRFRGDYTEVERKQDAGGKTRCSGSLLKWRNMMA